ncbi:signal peptidase I [Chakrabartyella piscis]|uniref:signal peptidase I n=1 Tax=Chakrabartyella piscis TaxID=2918914 RepID=UPI0029587505|nr:signal peptidase I [Chakrabartyella piscis]
MKSETKKEIISWIKTLVLAVAVAWFVNHVLIVNAQVPTGSMETTIMPGDRIIALRTSYWFDEPEFGDVVIFPFPDDPTGDTLYVKRVIGVGGDVVEGKDGKVYVNDVALEEPYIGECIIGNFGPYSVPEGTYFMMGDNRNSSLDARYWENKFVSEDEVLGKVVCKYYKGFGMIE